MMPLNGCASYDVKRSSWVDNVKISPNRYIDNFSKYLGTQEYSVNYQLKRVESSVVYTDDSDFYAESPKAQCSRITSNSSRQ